jgi:hypothetical protein
MARSLFITLGFPANTADDPAQPQIRRATIRVTIALPQPQSDTAGSTGSRRGAFCCLPPGVAFASVLNFETWRLNG